MVEFNKDELLNNFNLAVESHEYMPIPYKKWRALKAIPGDKIKSYLGPDYNKIRLEWYNTSNGDNGLIGMYDTNDGSFGAYVNHCTILEEVNRLSATTNNPIFVCNIPPMPNIDAVTEAIKHQTEVTKEFDDAFKHLKTNIDKENEKMNMFNFDFGPVSGNQFRMSPYGLAVRTEKNGWIAYDVNKKELMDVDVLNFDISKLVYKMPVALAAVKPGDILMHCGKPVFVREVATGGSTIQVINYADATVLDILPVKSPFGFNFYTKVCPLVDMTAMNANSDNPFGNILPFLLMGDNKDIDPMMLMMMMNGGQMDFTKNPMMLYFLMSQKGDKNDMLPFLMATTLMVPQTSVKCSQDEAKTI